MSLPQRVASTQSNQPRRRPRSPLIAFEPAASPQRPPNGQTNHAGGSGRSLALCCGPVSGNRERAYLPQAAFAGPMAGAAFVIQASKARARIMRYELTDHEWTAIRPMLPNKPRGVPRVNDRRVLNGIFWVPRSGAPGRDLPATLAGCIAAPELRYASSVRCLAGRAIRPGRRRLLRV